MNKPPSIRNFIKEIYQAWINEKPNQLAAALAYFGMFSFAAVIYLAYQIAGIFINEAAAAERLYTRVEAVLGWKQQHLSRIQWLPFRLPTKVDHGSYPQ